MKIFAFFLFLCSSLAFACEINLPTQIVVVGSSGHAGSVVKHENCKEVMINELVHTLAELDGRIGATQLTSMMTIKGYEQIKITPQMIQVQQLRSFIRDQLPLPSGIQIKSTQGMNVPDFLALAPGDKLEIQCDGCLYGKTQAVNVVVREFEGTSREFLAAVDFRKMVRAYRVRMPLQAFSEITTNELKEEYTEAIPHTDLLTDAQTLKFFKTNKPLKPGELLRISDLTGQNLVKAGLKTDVILENDMVKIKTQGISRSNGVIGDLVEVYHPQKNKKYQGKVIDHNKVLVEL